MNALTTIGHYDIIFLFFFLQNYRIFAILIIVQHPNNFVTDVKMFSYVQPYCTMCVPIGSVIFALRALQFTHFAVCNIPYSNNRGILLRYIVYV